MGLVPRHQHTTDVFLMFEASAARVTRASDEAFHWPRARMHINLPPQEHAVGRITLMLGASGLCIPVSASIVANQLFVHLPKAVLNDSHTWPYFPWRAVMYSCIQHITKNCN